MNTQPNFPRRTPAELHQYLDDRLGEVFPTQPFTQRARPVLEEEIKKIIEAEERYRMFVRREAVSQALDID